MKKVFVFLMVAIVSLSTYALTPKQMGDRTVNFLLGNVKTVTCGEIFQSYDRLGCMTVYRGADWEWKRKYSTATTYTQDAIKYRISYTTKSRKDACVGNCAFGPGYPVTECKFNMSGQMTSVAFNDGGWGWCETYSYSSKTDKFPKQRVLDYDDERDGTKTTDVYDYLEFDSYGNWTKRKVTRTEAGDSYGADSQGSVSEFVEARTITYY